MKVLKRLRVKNVIYLPGSEIQDSLVEPGMLIAGFVELPKQYTDRILKQYPDGFIQEEQIQEFLNSIN